MKMNKLISNLFRLARLLIDFKAITSGNIGKMARRGKNKILGRKLIRKIW
ncbi:hypothetical protein ES705_33214 [subsurface metagenome]